MFLRLIRNCLGSVASGTRSWPNFPWRLSFILKSFMSHFSFSEAEDRGRYGLRDEDNFTDILSRYFFLISYSLVILFVTLMVIHHFSFESVSPSSSIRNDS